MAQVIIDINDAIAPDVRDTLYVYWGGVGNPTNAVKMAFLKTTLAKWIKSEYISAKSITAESTARSNSRATTEPSDIT